MKREAKLAKRAKRDLTRLSRASQTRGPSHLRAQLARPLTGKLRAARAARTNAVLASIEDLFDTGRLTPGEVGAPSKRVFLARMRRLLDRLGHERYTTTRLRESHGLRGSWFGEVWEEVAGNLPGLRDEIRSFANGEKHLLQDLIAAGSPVVLTGRGDVVAKLTVRPRGRFGPVEQAVDVRLVPRGGARNDRGLKYTDRMEVSFSGSGEDVWMGLHAAVEIKVPRKGWKLAAQTAEAVPRMKASDFLSLTIVDANGRFLRTQVVPVDRILINTASTNRIGLTANKAGREGWRIASGTARGFKEAHVRIDVPVSARGALLVTKAMFSRAALRPDP